MRTWAALAFGALLAIAACSSFDEGAPDTVAPDRDGGSDGDAQPGDPCANRVLYVSHASGNDAREGCSQGDALATVSGALALAAARKREGFEIRICGGVYAEPNIRMTIPITLRGGWNCNTWTRGPEDVTRFENAGYPSQPVTLTISGSAIGRDSVVDAITIASPAAGNASATAVLVDAGARPLLTKLVILGGAPTVPAPDAPFGSLGIYIRGGAGPEIAETKIKIGPAVSAAAPGGIGVLALGGGAVDLHDSDIEMDNATGVYGSIGVQLVAPPRSRIVRTRFKYAGTTVANSSEGAYGVYVTGGELDIAESFFRGVVAGCGTATGCKIAGVVARDAAKISVHRTAIYAGDIQSTQAVQAALTYGIYLGPEVDATVTSSVIHAGAVASDTDTVASSIEARGTSAVRISGNTLLSTGANAFSRAGVRIGTVDGNTGGTGNNVVVGNLFVGRGEGPGVDAALVLASCGGTSFSDVTKNAFVNEPATLADVVGTSCSNGIADFKFAIADLQQYLSNLGGTASGNLLLRSSPCPECISGVSCTSPTECAGKVFAVWDQATGGLTPMESTQALRISASVPCAIRDAYPAFVGTAVQDFFGTQRTAPFSLGHHEIETCQ